MDRFSEAVNKVTFQNAKIPVYQNVDAQAHVDADEIRDNIIKQ